MVKKKKKANDNKDEEVDKTLKNDQKNKIDPPKTENIKYDINNASKYLIKVFKDSEEYKKAKDEKSKIIMYDKWRKKGDEQ